MRGMFTAAGLACAVTFGAVTAGAAEPATKAGKLFDEAKALREKGETEAACSRFAESYKLEPGVGVALYLGDCYERLGRTASAWSAFRDAQRLAEERGDNRAEVARKRVEALGPHVTHLKIAMGNAPPNAAVSLDGQVLPAASLNAALATDPGDHVIALDVPGQPQHVEHAHIEPDAPVFIVHLEAPPPPAPAPKPPAPPPPAAAPPPMAPPPPPAASEDGASRRWMLVGLLAGGVAGVGTGAAFLALKNQSMTTGSTSGTPPQVDERASAASVVAFGAGGSALVAAVVVFLTTPHRKSAASLQLTPAAVPGGGGAVLLGSF